MRDSAPREKEGDMERAPQEEEDECNLSIKDTMKRGHLSNEGTTSSPNHIELCTNPPLN